MKEKTTPIAQGNLEKNLKLPLYQSIVAATWLTLRTAALMLFIRLLASKWFLDGWVADVIEVIDVWTTGFFAVVLGIFRGGASWEKYSEMSTEWLYRREVETSEDIDGDGWQGKPPSTKIYLPNGNNGQKIITATCTRRQMLVWARGVLAKEDLTYRRWVRHQKLFVEDAYGTFLRSISPDIVEIGINTQPSKLSKKGTYYLRHYLGENSQKEVKRVKRG